MKCDICRRAEASCFLILGATSEYLYKGQRLCPPCFTRLAVTLAALTMVDPDIDPLTRTHDAYASLLEIHRHREE